MAWNHRVIKSTNEHGKTCFQIRSGFAIALGTLNLPPTILADPGRTNVASDWLYIGGDAPCGCGLAGAVLRVRSCG